MQRNYVIVTLCINRRREIETGSQSGKCLCQLFDLLCGVWRGYSTVDQCRYETHREHAVRDQLLIHNQHQTSSYGNGGEQPHCRLQPLINRFEYIDRRHACPSKLSSKVPLLVREFETPSTRGSFRFSEVTAKRHLDRFIRFYRAHGHDRQTDAQITQVRHFVCGSFRILVICTRCGLITDLHELTRIYMYRVRLKLLSPGFSGIMSPTTKNFPIKFYTFIACSYLCKTAQFYPVISNFAKVMAF